MTDTDTSKKPCGPCAEAAAPAAPLAELHERLDQLGAEVAELRGTCVGAVMFVGNLQRGMERAQLRARAVRAHVAHAATRPEVHAAALAVAIILARRYLGS